MRPPLNREPAPAGGRFPTGHSRRKTGYILPLTRARESARRRAATCRLGERGNRGPVDRPLPGHGAKRGDWLGPWETGCEQFSRCGIWALVPASMLGVVRPGGRIPLLARAYDICRVAAAPPGAGSGELSSGSNRGTVPFEPLGRVRLPPTRA